MQAENGDLLRQKHGNEEGWAMLGGRKDLSLEMGE